MLGFALGLLQMLLYAIYRKGNKKVITKEERPPLEPLKSVVIATPLGTGEVLPVEANEQGKKNEEDEDPEKEKKEKSVAPDDCAV